VAVRVALRLAAGLGAVVRAVRVECFATVAGAGVSAVGVAASATGALVDESVAGGASAGGAGSVVVGGALVSVVTGWDCGTSWARAVVEVSARAATIAGRALVCA